MIRSFERIRNRTRRGRKLTSAINFGYCKNGTRERSDSIVGTDVSFLGCPWTVEELAQIVTFSVDGSLLAIRILLALSWSVKGAAMLFDLQLASAPSESQRLELAG